jgi:CrcB protein
MQDLAREQVFPYGTLACNLIGCLVIGLLAELADARGVFTPEMRALVFIGVLGGFTTYSSFANETVNLSRDGAYLLAGVNVSVHIVCGLGAVWAGRMLGHFIWR